MNRDGEIVWRAMLDCRFRVQVERRGPWQGQFSIADETGTVLLQEPVSLSYGAMFGPDGADVRDWQHRAEHFIAWFAREEEGGNPRPRCRT
jgi:hypothetical protein